MTTITNWPSPSVMHALGSSLVHFLWQGAALAALAAATMALCRRASSRYVIGVSMLVLMPAAPVLTLFLLTPPDSTTIEKTRLRNPDSQSTNSFGLLLVSAKSPLRTPSPDTLPWLVEAWLIGVAFFSLRTMGGFLLLQHRQRTQSAAVSGRLLDICRALQQRVGIHRAICFCECKWLQAPAVVGWFRPVVLFPITALTGLSEDQLQSVIVHELAHIKRFDAFVNVFQIGVETLLFYHPAVWWLNKRIRTEREHCCDDLAVSLCGNPVEYARALTRMEEWRAVPALAMAANASPLTERIRRLLGLSSASNKTRGVGLAGSILCLSAALTAGSVLLGIAFPKRTAQANGSLQFQLGFRPTASSAQAPSAAPAAKPSPAPATQHAEEPMTAQSYIDGLKAAGLTNLMADDLIALKIQGVTPEYVREIHDLGFTPDADGLVGLKVQGVTPQYVRDLRATGLNPDQDQIIGLKVQGVTADYVRGLKEVGIQGDADEVIGLKVQGVTPAYVRDLRTAGLTVDAENVIGLKVQGVTADYVHGLHDQGLQPDSDEVIGMRVQGVTPEYVRDLRAAGLKLSPDQIVGLKVQGVTPEYVKALRGTGLNDFRDDPDSYISAKVQGITPEFIAQVQKHGFKDIDLDKLIEIKNLGILENKGEI